MKKHSVKFLIFLFCMIFIALTGTQFAYAAENYSWAGVKWSSNWVAYDDHTLPSNWQSGVSYSASQWSSVTPSPITLYRNTSSNNDVYKANLPSNKTAYTYRSSIGSNITRMRIEINYNFSWNVLASPPPSNQYDLRHTLSHEFGHGLGFQHATGCPSDMWSRASMCNGTGPGQYWKRSLNGTDKAGLNAVYP